MNEISTKELIDKIKVRSNVHLKYQLYLIQSIPLFGEVETPREISESKVILDKLNKELIYRQSICDHKDKKLVGSGHKDDYYNCKSCFKMISI